NDQSGGRNDKFEDMFVNSRSSNIQSEIEVLRSRPLMERVVNKLGLQFSYEVKGKIKTLNIYKQGPFLVEAFEITDSFRVFLLKLKFLNDTQFRVNDDKTVLTFGQLFKNANGVFRVNRIRMSGISKEYNIKWQPSSSAAGMFAGSLQIIPKTSGTGILSISMQTTNAQMGADVINKLMEEYGDYSIEQKNKTYDQILAFIASQLQVYGHALDSVQRKLTDYEVTYNIFDPEVQSGNFITNMGEGDKVIIEQRTKMDMADMIDTYLKDKNNDFVRLLVPSAFGIEDLTLNTLVAAYNKAQLDRQQLLEAAIPVDNPQVVQATAQIEQLRISIRENLANLKSTYSYNINQFTSRNSKNESQLRSMPARLREREVIKRQVDALQALYKFLQEQKEATSISRASTISNSSIIDKSYATTIPVKPNKRAIRILAVLLGLGLPALIIFIGEILNDKVTTRFDIEKITPVPILGEIGHSYSNKSMIVNRTTRSMVAEQFRIIRSNLQYILNKQEKSVILVTSSFSGEGKSFVTTNMGSVLALAGKKTIILEFDIRKPKILSGLNMSKGQGITNFLVGKATIEELIRPVEGSENLFVIGCGPVPPNPAELLLDQKVEELFAWLRKNYDMILVDTAPVGMVSDAMTLSKFADSTMYLVRQGHTFKKQVVLIDEFYRENKLPKVSIIINDVKMKPGYGYYGYGRYGYGYGYGYGSYYEEEVPPKSLFEKILTWLDVTRLFTRARKK
ncbi:MAG TPA: polysaccharide biosynthesis tyrosine autokinase, partial [Chitinophagaceae bacterium]|nr:polysaccharide biosynthesis tyrosine autokinase [Chitinophagaceae bacterium]